VSAADPFDSVISCIGVSHHGAPLELLERLSIPSAALPCALEHFAARGADGERLCEGVILSTCNRTEIYAAGRPTNSAAQPSAQPADGMPEIFSLVPPGLVAVLSRSSGLSPVDIAARMFRHDGWAAAEHLFRVVCGLDSLVIGESQVVGQVARAYAAAQKAGTAGVVLSTLFQSAIRGGRRARARIGIGRSASNAGTAALDRAESAVGSLVGARVIVIGTGQVGRIVLQALRQRRVGRVDILSRSAERAAAVAERWGCVGHAISGLSDLVGESDLLISTAGAAERLVPAEMVRAAMSKRAGRQLLLIDLAVPRTIDPAASAVPGVHLLDIDSLKIETGADTHSPEAIRIGQMIGEDLTELRLRMKELFVRPVIGDLWRKAAAIRGSVLERARERLPHLDEQSWAEVEDLATSLVARLLHDPSTRLRAVAGNGHAEAFSEALRELFDIPAPEKGK
jgi:glutamyl-tRNA reductase